MQPQCFTAAASSPFSSSSPQKIPRFSFLSFAPTAAARSFSQARFSAPHDYSTRPKPHARHKCMCIAILCAPQPRFRRIKYDSRLAANKRLLPQIIRLCNQTAADLHGLGQTPHSLRYTCSSPSPALPPTVRILTQAGCSKMFPILHSGQYLNAHQVPRRNT